MYVKIVADSCCDLSEELKSKMKIELVPLTLRLEDRVYVDDDKLDVKEYINDMNRCETSPKTSCPSPHDFLKAYQGQESVFVVTLSSKLSGTYNSAVLARDMFLEDISHKFIHVFDSLSASAAETLISLKIHELADKGIGEIEIVETVSRYIKEMKTYFVSESLEHLAKAGRLNPIIAKIASVLNIKPLMGADDEGNIKLVEKVRGYRKALTRLVEMIGEEGSRFEEKIIGIAHCNCLERALHLKEEILKKYNFKDIIIVDTAGLSSTYVDDGGIIVAF